MLSSLVLATSTVLFIASYVVYSRARYYRPPLPPGPNGLPIVGNLFNIPPGPQWMTFDKWLKQYGSIVYIKLLGQPIIILGSSSATSEIFDRKSALFSSRPRMTMMNELMGFDYNFAFMPYGRQWREDRRLFHQQFRQGVIPRYHPAFSRNTRKLLCSLLTQPNNFFQHIRHTFAAIILDATYGLDVVEHDDPYVTVSEKAMQGASAATVPGAFLVENLPILKYIPAWVPGAGFQTKALQWKRAAQEMFHKPFEAVKIHIREGNARPSVAATMWQSLAPELQNPDTEYSIKAVGATAYGGGADTTISTVDVFILAMAMNPEVQQRAQAELDAIVGPSRLPDFSDRSSLPYINAIIKEVIRWQPVFPIGIAHASIEDDEFNGYFIPKGSIVVGCTWSILHDPANYPEPEKFMPERFLDDNGKLNSKVQDPAIAAFGYGRRICPGRFFVDDSLYSVVSSILATFDIALPLQENGKPMKLKPLMMPGVISHPVPFECIIKPRSNDTADLISKSMGEVWSSL